MPQYHHETQNLYEQFLDVRRNLSEASASYWLDLEIYKKLNEAQQFIARKSLCLKKTVNITTVASTQEYDLKDNSFADIMDIAEDGVYFKINGSSTNQLPLKRRTIAQLNKESSGWRGVSASIPQYYYYDKATKTIGLYPKPNSANAGAYLYVTGNYFPKVLHAGTAVSGTTAQIVLAAGSATAPYPSVTNDYYNNIWIEIYYGAGVGERVEITDYVGSTKTCTATFTTAPDATSIYGMIAEIPASMHWLMPIYALSKLWGKGGSRSQLGLKYWNEFINGLSSEIGDFIGDEDEEIIKDNYR